MVFCDTRLVNYNGNVHLAMRFPKISKTKILKETRLLCNTDYHTTLQVAISLRKDCFLQVSAAWFYPAAAV